MSLKKIAVGFFVLNFGVATAEQAPAPDPLSGIHQPHPVLSSTLPSVVRPSPVEQALGNELIECVREKVSLGAQVITLQRQQAEKSKADAIDVAPANVKDK